MNGSDWGDYSQRAAQQPATQPGPAPGRVQVGSAALPAEAIPPPSTSSPAQVPDAAQVSSEAQAATKKTEKDWPPRISILPLTTNKQLQDHTGDLRQATEKMEKDLKSGADPATLKEDAVVLEALMAVQVARDKMDKAILDAFDRAMESARKMMEQYKEWLNKVKIPDEQKNKELEQKKELNQAAAKQAAAARAIQANKQ